MDILGAHLPSVVSLTKLKKVNTFPFQFKQQHFIINSRPLKIKNNYYCIDTFERLFYNDTVSKNWNVFYITHQTHLLRARSQPLRCSVHPCTFRPSICMYHSSLQCKHQVDARGTTSATTYIMYNIVYLLTICLRSYQRTTII